MSPAPGPTCALGAPFSEIVVLSHLRWDWVWQRPQHLISRLGRGLSTIFVEEPVGSAEAVEPTLVRRSTGTVDRIWLDVPTPDPWIGFGHERATGYTDRLLAELGTRPGRLVWLYTAMALPMAESLQPDLLVYDVMDDLTAFSGAAPEHLLRHRAALRAADIVFTGGRSLHDGVTPWRPADVHCFPSGVEPEHFAPAGRGRPARRERPVAGYVGVIDERLDLDLVADLAGQLPDWDVVMVGPVTKIDPATLPVADNLIWAGARSYDELVGVMASFDVALMPFARNDATRSISPTKTLEYFAAGLPVVSTRVPDVVADYGEVVALADDGAGFAGSCRRALADGTEAHRRRVAPILARQHWDTIAASMASVCRRHVADASGRGRSTGITA